MATAAFPLIDAPPQRREPELKKLSSLAMLLYPIAWRLTPPAKRDLLDRRVALTHKLRDKALAQAEVKKQLLAETKVYKDIIISAWSRLGEYHRARSESDGPAPREQPKRVNRVKFEWTGVEPERVYFKILTTRRTLFGTRSALPHRVRVIDLISEETLQELSFACNREVSAIADDYHRGVWVVVNRVKGLSGLPNLVTFSSMLDHYPTDVSKSPIILGVGEHRQVHMVNLADHPHVLIAGSTFGGKSNMVNNIICGLIRYTTPDELQIVLIDLKQMEFGFYRDTPHLHRPIIFTAQAALECLEEMVDEVQRRATLLSSKAKELAAWNKKYPDQAMPRLVVVIDEFAELMLASGKKVAAQVESLVTRIANLGRAVGIHLIICTQRPAVAVLPNSIKINMPLTIAGRTQSSVQSRTIIDDGAAADLPAEPRGRMIYLSGANRATVQTPFVSDDDVIESVRIARGRAARLITLKGNDVVIDRDHLILFIARKFGGMVSNSTAVALREYAIRTRLYQNFGRDLIKTGGVIKDGKSWRLVVTDADGVQKFMEVCIGCDTVGTTLCDTCKEKVTAAAAEPVPVPEPELPPAEPELSEAERLKEALVKLRQIRIKKVSKKETAV